MNSKLVAVGVGAFAYGAYVAWSITADSLEGKMRRNQLILGEMIRRREAEVVELEARLLDRVPWAPVTSEAVAAAAANSPNAGISLSGTPEEVAVEVEHDSIVDRVAGQEEVTSTDGLTEEQIAEAASRLESIIANYTSNEDDRDTFVAMAGREIASANEVAPFVIPVDVYASDPDEGDLYEKITLSYYPRPRILLDDDQELIADVDHVVGWKNLNSFGDRSADQDVVFIRNRRLNTDFEVVKFDDEDAPPHVRYNLSREEFKTQVAAGIIKLRSEDSD